VRAMLRPQWLCVAAIKVRRQKSDRRGQPGRPEVTAAGDEQVGAGDCWPLRGHC
jgi:hypothetical protein